MVIISLLVIGLIDLIHSQGIASTSVVILLFITFTSRFYMIVRGYLGDNFMTGYEMGMYEAIFTGNTPSLSPVVP